MTLLVSADGVPYGRFVRIGDATVPPAPLAIYAGRYRSNELETIYTIAETEHGLKVSVPRQPPAPLHHLHKHAFQMGDRTLRFELGEDSKATAFNLSSPRAQGLCFERRPQDSINR